ncbi:MAG: LamG domain-containing protein [Lentisphaerae bacterium]|jgi:hypothetical protein|nr:LamG domain-containing protein [Lentisphaerota bacterium]MBT5608711.1 LamG domain-containing protein [Lentisphaerota bacterium]MBT7056579.1 LamG domain-containing protein [Lentisphaerota bacterium]MBT7845046.1 LamG domain-containing protein [Lentisphaerota bacterium]
MVLHKKGSATLRMLFLIPALVLPSCATRKATVFSGVLEWRLGEFEVSLPPGLSRTGNPRLVDSPYGKAVVFDGKGDAFFLATNPLLGLRTFTVEVVVRPDAHGPKEQRFLHIGEPHGDRMLIETRLTDDGQWYLDTYLQSGESNRTLKDESLLHPVGRWCHVALVVDDGKMVNYVNGKVELEGDLDFDPIDTGRTSIGVRLNRVSWFKGAVYKVLITPRALKPDELTRH